MLTRRTFACLIASLAVAAPSAAADPFAQVAADVNERMVKIFGSGGFKGVVNYSSGMIISKEGHILTVASQTLDTSELIVHLYDGRRMKAQVLVTEPLLDIALIQIKVDGKKPGEPNGLDLPFFDLQAAAKKPNAGAGDWVLAFSNQFEIAMRDEPVSVQRGIVAAYTDLAARRGAIFDFPYKGKVYVVDAITNNPGAGGGALTDRKGNLLGIVGREVKNVQTETWINYAIPVNATVTVNDGGKDVTISIPEFVSLGMQGKYKPVQRVIVATGPGGYHGIVFVPNPLERTPPYVEEVAPNSPAAKAGLKPDDLVSFVDGEPIYSIKAFNEFIKKTRPGMKVRLEVRRGDTLQTIDMQLDEHPKLPAPAPTPATKN